ncbi:MAG: ABC transporter permease, partial [Lysobacterales bacterium]
MSEGAAIRLKRRSLSLRLGKLALGTNAWLAFAFLYIPILVLILFSFNDSRSVARWTGFSMEWYLRLFDNEPLLRAARNSMLIALVSTLAATAMGTLTALGMDRYRFRLKSRFEAILYLPIVIPEIVMGISLLLFF